MILHSLLEEMDKPKDFLNDLYNKMITIDPEGKSMSAYRKIDLEKADYYRDLFAHYVMRTLKQYLNDDYIIEYEFEKDTEYRRSRGVIHQITVHVTPQDDPNYLGPFLNIKMTETTMQIYSDGLGQHGESLFWNPVEGQLSVTYVIDRYIKEFAKKAILSMSDT